MTLKTSDDLALHLYDWSIPEPVLRVAIVHGYGEHAGRYEQVAKRWQDKKIATYAVDLRGHGKSPGPRGHIDRFTDYHRDVDALVDHVTEQGGPVAVLGHSMGGLLATHWVLSGRGNDLAGLVLSSPYLGLALEVPAIKLKLGDVMSSLWPSFAQASGLKGADVTRDPELAALYDSDPLNLSKATARWFTESNEAMASVHRRAGQLSLPVLLLYGGADRVASADATDRFAAALTGPDKTSERMDGCYHELLNEPEEVRNAVADRMADWLVDHAKTQA